MNFVHEFTSHNSKQQQGFYTVYSQRETEATQNRKRQENHIKDVNTMAILKASCSWLLLEMLDDRQTTPITRD